MNDLLTGLNGGNVPALELIFMITLVALLPSIVVMMTSLQEPSLSFLSPEMQWGFSRLRPIWC